MTELMLLAHSEADTDRLGRELAERADSVLAGAGLVVGLSGTLGAGKTRFVQAIAEAWGYDREQVVSPTFVLCHEYHGGRQSLYHLDAYRIRDDDEFLELGVEEMFAANAWVIIEWAERVRDCLPSDRLEIDIQVRDDDSRGFVFRATGDASQAVLRSLCK
ncbi:MAG: tRNA (adenosine(37)-N6)-threonylcarbamoyltransferase complex ATPase subunit type 1 TsaE [Pirellulaceae bacterium]|nr:tRNA (adenosine(37)-N6)-threonylcarbamoyltransferase complex ATPase subunit type 1 TsaE [Planctomycetales bacterium]MCA9225654.1 tRNA (adenosine(37)-N6)-threonylcarbamoyltransferase complex ATPase subunit type 1 TsaE [Planctomycetales bacterium]